MDWDSASDQEILDQLEAAELAIRLQNSDEWKLVHEAMRRTYLKHQKLLQDADPSETKLILNLQLICKMYSEDFLPQLIRNFTNIGEFAFQEAKERRLLDTFMKIWK